MRNRKKLIIFDLDGTLYEHRGGIYRKSALRRKVINNAQNYIAIKLSKSRSNARHIINNIQKRYGEQISIGLEKDYGLDRYDYFNAVWNIPARGIVKKTQSPRKTLLALRKKFKLVLVSDAPRVWIYNVLEELRIQDLFRSNIFSGEGNCRKGFSNYFLSIARTLRVRLSDCIVVGDQEHTDIIPAKKLGMNAIFIHRTRSSLTADICVKSIGELPIVLEKLSKTVAR